MRSKLLYFFSITAAMTLTGCPDPVCFNPEPSYSFAVTAHFTPVQDSIKVGDTLYLVSEFPSIMVPIGGLEAVTYNNSKGIASSLRIGELEKGNNVPVGAVAFFDYVDVSGQIYNSRDVASPDKVQQLRFDEDYGKYVLKIGIIPKKPGVYAFGIGNGFSNGRKALDECTKASFIISLDNPKSHVKYYENWLGLPVNPVPTNGYWIKVY